MQRNVFLSAVVLFSAVIAASSYAEGQSVEELKKAGDLRGLVAKDPRRYNLNKFGLSQIVVCAISSACRMQLLSKGSAESSRL